MPGQQSTIVKHPRRTEIEARLRKGDPATHIAADFNLSRQAVSRFKARLLAGPEGTVDGGRVAMMRQVRVLYNSTVDLMTKAKAANAPRSFLAATAEARRCLNLMSKILGLLNEMPPAAVAVVVNIDIEKMEAVILSALTPFPEARRAVASALVEHGDGEAGGDQ